MIHLMLEIVGVWFLAILIGMPLFASMGLAAFAFVIFSELSPSIVPQKMAQAMNSFPLVAAPLFILMGNLLGAARLTDRIVRFATSLVGSLRGGYAHASILSSMIFAGMVGSAVADAAGTGAVEVRAMKKAGYRPETAAAVRAAAAAPAAGAGAVEGGAMKKAGYRPETAAAISAAAATIGPIIPPSLPMVIYGVSADVSIGRLFLAGVIPGVLMGLSLMTLVAIIAPRQGLPRHAFGGLSDVWLALKESIWALLTPVILLGGRFSGLFTPTEAAAVACLYALFLGFVVYRTLSVKDLPAILINTAETTGIVAVLVMVAGALGWCMSISRIPQTVAPAIVAAIHEPLVFLFVSNLVLLAVGCFMEALAG